MEESVIELKLTVNEVNGILGAIGKMPFEQVVGLVDKIRSQAVPQVQAAQTEVEQSAE